jgi:predicted AAA+ superfamily ATPase
MKKKIDYIPRILENEVRNYINSPEIIAIIGPRQCGKTTLLNHIAASIKSTKITVIDFEDRDILNLFMNDIKAFVALYVQGQEYLFIDEFQYASQGGKHLKYIYDHFPIKTFISGSSSTELSLQSIQYLVGRIFVFNLYPLSFSEFLAFKAPKLSQILDQQGYISQEIIQKVNRYYTDFQIYGGYPRVALSYSNDEKETVIKNIYNTYLLREINQILNYQDEFKLTKLINALALQIGSNINYNELSTLTGFNHKELLEALDILEKTFVLQKSTPFFTNKRLELIKSPKFFFIDNGFRNMAIKNFLPSPNRTDLGALNENFIAAELVKKGYPIRYWRTKSKAEVDFILEDQGEIVPLEVKTNLNKASVSKSFRSFFEKYTPGCGYIASHQLYDDVKINDIIVKIVPHWYIDYLDIGSG